MTYKKSSIQDTALIMMLLITGTIMFVAVTVGYTKFTGIALNNSQINYSSITKAPFEATRDLQSKYDYVIFGVLIGGTLGIIITGWLVAGRALFAIIYFVGLVVLVVVASVFQLVWDKLSQNVPIGEAINSYFPISDFLMQHLAIYISIIGFIGMIILFAKPYFQGAQ